MQDNQEYTVGVDMGSTDGDYAIVHNKDGSFERTKLDKVDFRKEYNAKFKTGRRESNRSSVLYLGQRVSRIAACGHKVVPQSVPHTKCFDCWHLYFSLNAKTVYASFEFLRNGKEAELVAKHGSKFVKQFKRFVTHVQSIAPIQAEDAVTEVVA